MNYLSIEVDKWLTNETSSRKELEDKLSKLITQKSDNLLSII